MDRLFFARATHLVVAVSLVGFCAGCEFISGEIGGARAAVNLACDLGSASSAAACTQNAKNAGCAESAYDAASHGCQGNFCGSSATTYSDSLSLGKPLTMKSVCGNAHVVTNVAMPWPAADMFPAAGRVVPAHAAPNAAVTLGSSR